MTFDVVGICGVAGQGPYMAMVLKVSTAHVIKARYATYGCTVAQVCGQWLCDEIEGKALADIDSLDEQALIKGVGPMPLGREHCPGLTIKALRHAIEQIKAHEA